MTAPKYRAVDQQTGTVGPLADDLIEEMAGAQDKALREVVELRAETAVADATFAAAVGFYDCPCGSEFEFFADNGLEEWGALNRWLGEHVGKCKIGGQVAAFDCPERDAAIRERDDARAERDNMVNLTIEVGRLGTYLQHAIADREDYREQLDEMRDKYQAAQRRLDEMADELAELRAAKCDR
jgi:hypothetical protein